MNMFRINGVRIAWGGLVGGGAVGLPVAAGMILIRNAHPDAWDLLMALIAVAVGALGAGLWALRRGPMDEGRAATLGCLAWLLVSLLAFMATNPFYGIAWVLVGALPAAV